MSDHTVLIIEDESTIADVYREWLRDRYAVRVADDGATGLSKLDASVDVVVLDRRMPGLAGTEVLSRIESRDVQCRVAMVTAVQPDFDVLEMGFDEYLLKPVPREDLLRTVESLLARNTYDRKLDEYVRLVGKKATIEAETTDAERADSVAYEELLDRIEKLEASVDPVASELDDKSAKSLFREV